MAFNGEPVIVPRKENKNVVIVSEKDYKELEKARNNAAYLARLDLADEQIRQGRVVVKTMDELEAMAAKWAKLRFQKKAGTTIFTGRLKTKRPFKKLTNS